MASPQGKITLHYFDIRGLVEIIRLILEEAGVPYSDVRIPREEWYAPDGLKSKSHYQKHGICQFSQLPIVQIGDHYFAQSMSCARMLAKLHGLYGDDVITQYYNDMIADSTSDFRTQYGPVVYADPESYEGKLKRLLEEIFPKHLSQWNAVLAERNAKGHHFFAGEKVGYGDFVMFEILDLCVRLDANSLAKFPLLEDFHKRISERPRIKAYIESGRRPIKANNSGRG